MAFADLKRRLKAIIGIFRGGNILSTLRLLLAVIVKNFREFRVKMVVKHQHGPIKIEVESDDVIVLCPLRDGHSYLPHFVDYHRRLGVTHFVFFDNGSIDQSVDFIKAQPDTTLYSSELPFGSYKECFRRFLTKRYAKSCWVLLLDIDECFDYPLSERTSLKQLIAYLEENACTSVVAQMLDRFSERPILDPPSEDGDLSATYKYYDLNNLVEFDYSTQFGHTNHLTDEGILAMSGGVRNRFFDDNVLLTKHPLFRLKSGMGSPNNGHDITCSKVADFTAVLYHYKFNIDFANVLKRAMIEKAYYGGSKSYKKIDKRLAEEPELTLFTEDSKELIHAEELLESGFLRASDRFLNWVDPEGRRSS